MGVCVGTRVTVGVTVVVGDGVRVGVPVAVGVTVAAGGTVDVGVHVVVGVRVGVHVAVGVRVGVHVAVGVFVGVGVRMGRGVAVGVRVNVRVGETVAVGVGVGVGVAGVEFWKVTLQSWIVNWIGIPPAFESWADVIGMANEPTALARRVTRARGPEPLTGWLGLSWVAAYQMVPLSLLASFLMTKSGDKNVARG